MGRSGLGGSRGVGKLSSGQKHAVVIGATGLIGKQLVDLLLEEETFTSVKVIVRRSLDTSHEKLSTIILEDFGKLRDFASELNGTHFFCALGTTMKQAGSKEAFRMVDYDYPLLFAKVATEQADFEQFLIVSAAGANASSFIFYNKVKGQLERELENMSLKSLSIFQPSLLLGDRKESRLGEQIGEAFVRFFSFFRFGTRKMVGGIHSEDVARAMIKVAKQNQGGTARYNSDQMVDIVDI